MKPVTFAAVGILLLCAGVSAQMRRTDRGTMSKTDRAFMIHVSLEDMAEMKAGALAQKLGTIAAIKKYGRQAAEDHAKALGELKSIAASKGIELPSHWGSHSEQMDLFRRLSALRGAAFDNAYARSMREEHQRAIADFEAESRIARDRDLKAWVDKTLPILRSHMKMAMTLPASGMAHRHK